MTAAASSSRCSAARRRRGRSRRGRSSASGCGASACSWRRRETIRNRRPRIAAFRAGSAGIGLDRRPQRADRLPLGAADADALRKLCGGIGRARARRHPGQWQHGRGAVASRRPARSDRIRAVSPIRSAPASSLVWRGRAATPPDSRNFEYGIERQMAGAAQADRAGRDARGGPSGCRHSRRARPVRRNPGGGAIAWGGVKPDQRARRRRDRARRRGICAQTEWRPDRDGERLARRSSRSDRRACGPAQSARDLLRTALSSPPAA